MTTYGDISPRTAAFASRELLKRGTPYLLLEKFGQGKPLPSKSTKTQTWRRYEALDNTPSTLQEGVTPSANSLTYTDVTATLDQYGDRIMLTDVVLDTHEDPVLNEAVDILSEQAAQMIEKVRFNVVKAGSNVYYANGTQRSDVNSVLTLPVQRRITRGLKAQNARVITKMIGASPDYATMPVAPSFIAIAHSDVENDIRDMQGFVPVEQYGSMTPYESEIGKVENVRYLCSPIYEPWADAGGLAATNSTLSTTGTNSDVYPVLYIAADAYGIVPLKGKEAITPMVVNPKPSDSDPLAQRGHASWKTYQTAAILNDFWMARCEVAVSV